MIISPRSYKSDLQGCAIKFQSSAVKLVSKKRLLGVVVDNRALRRSFRQLPLQTRRTFLLSVIQPDLEYAASATVFNMSHSLRDRLIAMWRRAVRCAARAGCFDSIQPLLKKGSSRTSNTVGFSSLQQWFDVAILKLVLLFWLTGCL